MATRVGLSCSVPVIGNDVKLCKSTLFAGGVPVLKLLRKHLEHQGLLEDEAVLALVKVATEILTEEDNVVEVQAPAVVVGDLHGQFFDLLYVLDWAGDLGKRNVVFLGDYVDRGDYSVETILYLCAVKIAYPETVTLLRGNHETRGISSAMGLLAECNQKYPKIPLWVNLCNMFDCLPIAAVIHRSVGGDCFCVHGGIPNPSVSVDGLATIERRGDPSPVGVMDATTCWEMLWSDPTREWEAHSIQFAAGMETKAEWAAAPWSQATLEGWNSVHQTSFMYGPQAIAQFCAANKMACVIRGHEVQEHGILEYQAINAGDPSPLWSLFSAPNYAHSYINPGGVLLVEEGNTQKYVYQEAQQPNVVPYRYSLQSLTFQQMRERDRENEILPKNYGRPTL